MLHRHDNVHRQLAAFAELLRRVQSHYANDQLHQMLRAICVGVPDVPRRPGQQRDQWTTDSAQRGTCDVTSLSQLRRLVSGLRSGGSRRGGIQHKEHRAIVNYFERFFDDLDRLRDIKRYFHERIYACLYEHYYQPHSEHSISPTSTSYPDDHGCGGKPLATVLDQSDNDAPSPLVGRPLSEIVQQLWTLNRDWDLVLSKEGKDMVDTDEEPRMDDEQFVKITSIVPNWVEFGFKALQLAKIWWTTANRIYGRRPPTDGELRARSGSETVQRPYTEESEENDDVESVEEEVATLTDCACQISVKLDSLREELSRVRNHGQRVEALYQKLKTELEW